MIAAARTAGVREDQNLLRAVHERLCLGDIGTGDTGLKLLAPIASDDQPTGSHGDLGYLVGPEPLDDRIARGCDRRQCAECPDHPDACVERRAATPWGASTTAPTLGARLVECIQEVTRGLSQ